MSSPAEAAAVGLVLAATTTTVAGSPEEPAEEPVASDHVDPDAELSPEDNVFYENDLTQAIAPDPDMSLFTIIKSFISQLSVRAYYRISMPISFLQPVSLLDRTSNHAQPTKFLNKIHLTASPVERILRLMQWQLSTFLGVNRAGINASKPFNPVLGERFFCVWPHRSDSSSTYWLGEQVSHHPPITSFHCENPTRGFVYRGTVYPALSLGLNSITVRLCGSLTCVLTLPDGQVETYAVKFPSVCAAGILYGKLRVEVFDWLEIHGPDNLTAKVRFVYGTGGRLEGLIEQDSRKLYQVSGSFVEKAFISEPRRGAKKVTFVDFQRIRKGPKRVTPIHLQSKRESRRVWHSVVKAMLEERWEDASAAKMEIEEKERTWRAGLPEDWAPALFEVHGDGPTEDDDDVAKSETDWRIKDDVREHLVAGEMQSLLDEL